jgi:hypothetical protein
MPLVEAVGEPILPGNCQDQNHKRKLVSLLLRRIAASLFLPLLVANSVGCLHKRLCRECRKGGIGACESAPWDFATSINRDEVWPGAPPMAVTSLLDHPMAASLRGLNLAKVENTAR